MMTIPTVMYGSETWVNKTNIRNKIETSEMKFLRFVKGCTLRDQIRSSDIRQDLNITELQEKVKIRKNKWKEHVLRMQDDHIPKITWSLGRRDPGRPKRRWNEVGTG